MRTIGEKEVKLMNSGQSTDSKARLLERGEN